MAETKYDSSEQMRMGALVLSCLVAVLLPGEPVTLQMQSRPPAFLQKVETQSATDPTPGATVQCSLSRVRPGSMLMAVVRSSGGHHIAVTSNPAASWGEDVWRNTAPGTAGWSLSILTAANVTGGDTTITLAAGANDWMRAACLEYGGVAKTAHVEATASADGLGTMAKSGRVRTRGPNRLLVAAVATDSDYGDGQAYVALDGYILRLNAPAANDKIQVQDKVAATAGSYDARMQHSTPVNPSGDSWIAVLVAYRPGP